MSSRATAGLFSEPSGRRHGGVTFAAALAFAVLYAYSVRVAGSAGGGWLRFTTAGAALSGLAESLSGDRRAVADPLRAVA